MTRYTTYGPLLIMLAAGLWALDALIRTDLTQTIPPSWIVFLEHLIGLALLTPFLWRGRGAIRTLQAGDWVQLLVLSLVSSVFGTLLFTAALSLSFATFDFATPVLLQKMQPLFVIALAAMVLRERLPWRYLVLVPVALAGSYLVSFGATPVPLILEGKMLIYVLSIGAAFAWGSGTILSKAILSKLDFSTATGVRFLLAVPLSLAVALVLDADFNPLTTSGADFIRFVIIAFTTGAGAILLYYRGLRYTPARIATMAELTFPVVTILIAVTALNPYGAPQALSLANSLGIIVLLGAILAISFDASERTS